eukprot:CAMPEP_0181212530 /NCGR_PEP_ID=MMETSP1096-20121128/24400_1 /TAXON_ID=156174 ORGANISM="Chrysochromulina ericina, Strain CCMP281" /NCGR_SAMPLE_ID=MMETSP1096 /ASSEMBLY_ACC=CAM_ASM_000453 /LENGTH=135 /DNA_ID=CAMNT_0023304067 /DNA_START=165 /DNA_END=572 /DNA_ORIENTATION=+
MSLPPRASPRLLGAQLVNNNFAPRTPPHCAAITHPLISPTSPPSAAPNSPRPTAIDHIMNEARNGGQGTHGLTLSMTAWYLSRRMSERSSIIGTDAKRSITSIALGPRGIHGAASSKRADTANGSNESQKSPSPK